MKENIRFIGIIPARYASTRFPGKPLADICGKPMIQCVYEQAAKVLQEVYVATDDQRIYDCVSGFGGKVIMTSEACRCGTERCEEAWNKIKEADTKSADDIASNRTVIINIQGDEPFIQPEQIEAIISCFPTEIATLVKPYTDRDSLADLENPNTPKVVFSQKDGHAILFSRAVIPYLRGVAKEEWLQRGKYYKHIGMYAYRADILSEITQLAPTPLEQAESLEQLRWLENGYRIKVAVCETNSIGIDTPDDLIKAREYFAKRHNI